MIRTIILVAYYICIIPLTGMIGIPHAAITGNPEKLYWMAMSVAFFGLRMVGVSVEIVGLDQLDASGTYIYLCNHVSNIDPPLVVPMVPRRASVLAKKEVFRIPILATAMRLVQFVPIDRSNREAAIASVQRAIDVLKSGINVFAYPEGTRSRNGRLLPFKKGAFHLAMESGVPIVPMTVTGLDSILPKGEWRLRKGRAKLVFHAPILPAQFSNVDSLIAAVRDKIASGLSPEFREGVESPAALN